MQTSQSASRTFTFLAIVLMALSRCQQNFVCGLSRHLSRTNTWKSLKIQGIDVKRYASASSEGVENVAKVNTKKEKKKKGSESTPIETRNSTEGLEDFRQARIQKLNQIREKGGNPFAYTFSQTHKVVNLVEKVREITSRFCFLLMHILQSFAIVSSSTLV